MRIRVHMDRLETLEGVGRGEVEEMVAVAGAVDRRGRVLSSRPASAAEVDLYRAMRRMGQCDDDGGWPGAAGARLVAQDGWAWTRGASAMDGVRT